MTKLTQNKVKFEWVDKQETAFQLLKQKLCSTPILSLPEGSEYFIVYCDASIKGLGTVLMQREKVMAYASRQLKIHEKNYTTHDLELGAIEANVVRYALEQEGTRAPIRFGALVRLKELVAMHGEFEDCDHARVKAEHQRPSVLFGTTDNPWKYDNIQLLWNDMSIPIRHKISNPMDKLVRMFASNFWRSLLNALGTSLDMSIAYHPQIDGQSERTIQTLEDMLRACEIDFGVAEKMLLLKTCCRRIAKDVKDY
ncbi:putative reverse transcriptase domain-containing protein [Tanacetum coccineum]